MDAAGESVVGARVVFKRLITTPGPETTLESVETTTNEAGIAAFVREETVDTVLPLMMHGVPQLGFALCAERDEQSTEVALDVDPLHLGEPPLAVTVTLDRAGSGCGPAEP